MMDRITVDSKARIFVPIDSTTGWMFDTLLSVQIVLGCLGVGVGLLGLRRTLSRRYSGADDALTTDLQTLLYCSLAGASYFLALFSVAALVFW